MWLRQGFRPQPLVGLLVLQVVGSDDGGLELVAQALIKVELDARGRNSSSDGSEGDGEFYHPWCGGR